MVNIPSITSEPENIFYDASNENSTSEDQNQLSDELVSANAAQSCYHKSTLAYDAIPTLEAHSNKISRTPKPEFERIDIIPRIIFTIPEEDENSSNDIETDSEDDDETNAKEIDLDGFGILDDDDFEDDGDEYFICGVFFTVVIVLTAFFLYVEYFRKL